MKILTITTYLGYNYGASLQAYALQTYLKKQGHDSQVIRLEFEYLMRYYAFWYVNPDSKLSRNFFTRMIYRIAKWGQRRTTLKRKAVFDFFNHKVLDETNVFKKREQLYNNPPKADMYLCGSDQIWNVLYEAGQDPIFYLDFVKKGKKASYAASFSYLDLPCDHYERICHSLKSFDGISVREYQGKELLDKMGLESTWVLDPVFLLTLEDWDSLIERKDILRYENDEPGDEKYLLVYDFELGNDGLKAFALDYATRHELKIYAIVDRFPLSYAEKNFKNAGPVDFVRLIKGCNAFVSNSFHGTVFSMLYHKPFYVFNRRLHKVNSRMESLLKAFNLEDTLMDSEDKIMNSEKVIFDWEYVEKLKAEQLDVSVDYLRKLGV